MQKFFYQLLGVAFLTGTLFFSACSPEEDGGGDNDVAPQATLVAESGLISDNAEVAPGTTFVVKLRTTPGTSQIKTVTVLEDGVKLPFDRFTIKEGGTTITTNNPFLVLGTSKGGSIYELAIKAHTGINITKKYTFEVADDNGRTDEVAVNITTKGTELVELTGKLLRNQDGPAGQGGLDLDTGESVGSIATMTGNPAIDTSYKRAEINDEGNVSNTNSTWRQIISPTNGAAVRYIDKAKLPENFSYENVKTLEEIIGAFDSGIKFKEVVVNGMIVDFESNKVVEGDVFTVKTPDNRYFIIKVTKITVTSNDNNDSYTFSIKKKK